MDNFFSATVIVAITIFAVREILEAPRRGKIDGRRRLAIRTLLTAEIERNHYAIKTLKEIIRRIDGALAGDDLIEISRDANGRTRIKVGTEDSWTSWQVPTIHNEVLTKNIMDLAVLDKLMFELTLRAIDAVAEVDHLRAGLVEQIALHSEEQLSHLGSFSDYANHTLDLSHKTIERLYIMCTGRRLETVRAR